MACGSPAEESHTLDDEPGPEGCELFEGQVQVVEECGVDAVGEES